MKNTLCSLLALLAVALVGCQAIGRQVTSKQLEATLRTKESDAMSMQKTYQFLKDAGHYYLATVDQDQPRVRPFGTALIYVPKRSRQWPRPR